jgi:hypothetical protein
MNNPFQKQTNKAVQQGSNNLEYNNNEELIKNIIDLFMFT